MCIIVLIFVQCVSCIFWLYDIMMYSVFRRNKFGGKLFIVCQIKLYLICEELVELLIKYLLVYEEKKFVEIKLWIFNKFILQHIKFGFK